MTHLQPALGRDDSLSQQIWVSPMWPMMAALVVLGCAGLGLAHKHGRMITHGPAPVAAQEVKAAPSGDAVTPVTFTRPQTLPATQSQ